MIATVQVPLSRFSEIHFIHATVESRVRELCCFRIALRVYYIVNCAYSITLLYYIHHNFDISVNMFCTFSFFFFFTMCD